jgi:hypothetical protein
MQGFSKIRWKQSDEEKLKKVVKSYNAKRNRLIKKDLEYYDILPSSLSVKDLRKMLKEGSRKNFNKTLKEYERFLRKGSEQIVENANGVRTTKWQKKEIENKVKSINMTRQAELERLKKIDPNIEGKPHLTMGNTSVQNLKPKKFNFDKIRKGKEWEKFVESVEKQAMESYTQGKYDEYKRRYLKAIDNILGEAGDELKKIIETLDPKFIYDAYYKDPLLTIDYVYDPAEQKAIIDVSIERWKKLANEEGIEIPEDDI